MGRSLQRAASGRRAARLAAFTVAASLALSSGLAGCAGSGGKEGADNAELLEQMREMQAERRAAEQSDTAKTDPTVEERLREGDQLRQSGDLARAVWSYLRAHAIDRQDPRPLARIGEVQLQLEPERAEAVFLELLQSTGGSPAARTGLGLALIARQNWPQAIAELRAALAADRELAVAHDALGVALERTGDVAGARQCYRNAAKLQPRSHEPLNNLGVSYLRTGELATALEMFEAAARIEPRDPAVANNLGLALGRLERYDEALAAFRTATDSEQAALNNLGYVHFLNGDYAGALEVYERALLVQGNPEDRLSVLRNLRAAKRAQDAAASGATATEPPAPEGAATDGTTAAPPEAPEPPVEPASASPAAAADAPASTPAPAVPAEPTPPAAPAEPSSSAAPAPAAP
jgi:Flp pilus assembly protein TadD